MKEIIFNQENKHLNLLVINMMIIINIIVKKFLNNIKNIMIKIYKMNKMFKIFSSKIN